MTNHTVCRLNSSTEFYSLRNVLSSAPKFPKPVYLLPLAADLPTFDPFSDWPLTLKMVLPKMPKDTFKSMAILDVILRSPPTFLADTMSLFPVTLLPVYINFILIFRLIQGW